MVEVIKVFKEKLPAVKLIGKRYTDADRDQYGGYAAKWHEWFQNGYFECLKGCGIEKISDDYVGAMRNTETGFEYWIGILMAPNDVVPEQYESVEIASGELGVCYVYGNPNNGELFNMEIFNTCLKKFKELGMNKEDGFWIFERYNCPRYTMPDEMGNVILDYCAHLG